VAEKSLLEIYQLEKDWKRSIAAATSLTEETGQSYAKEIANFYCEIATAELAKPDLPAARTALESALAANRRCVRASILAGDCALRDGDTMGAIEAWRRIGEQNPTFIALVARRLVDAYRALGRGEDGLALLQQYLASHPSLDLLDVTFQSAIEMKGADEAHKLVRDELLRNPSLLGLDRLLEAQLLTAPAERRPEIEMVKNLVHGQTRRLARYRCESCGFKARQFYWQCPACASWETYPPKRTEEFDVTP
jgi:lipopolysaccharide assembly protein B